MSEPRPVPQTLSPHSLAPFSFADNDDNSDTLTRWPPMTVDAWPMGDEVWLYDASDRYLLKFSLQFLVEGKMNNWQYLRAQVWSCFICLPDEPHDFFDANGNLVDESQFVVAGTYKYAQYVLYKVPGPRGAYIFDEVADIVRHCGKKYRTRSDVSAVSLGSATTEVTRPESLPRHWNSIFDPSIEEEEEEEEEGEELHFEDDVVTRDNRCIVSYDDIYRCRIARIIPKSRPDLYREVLGEHSVDLTSPSFGLLLSRGLRFAFERFEIGFWPDGEDLIFHSFLPFHQDLEDCFHGEIIPRSRFRCNDDELPNHALLKFHYQQCAIMRFRGPSSPFPDPPTDDISWYMPIAPSHSVRAPPTPVEPSRMYPAIPLPSIVVTDPITHS